MRRVLGVQGVQKDQGTTYFGWNTPAVMRFARDATPNYERPKRAGKVMMEDFYTYIRKLTFHPEIEWHPTGNQVIRLLYRTLGWLVRDGWDSLVFTRTQVLYGKDGNLSQHFDEIECHESRATGLSECTPFREAMRLIMEHDERVREHFHLAEETPEAVTYHIVPEVISPQ